ncbi:MAG TPA: cytochrome c3 family protein [Kofleriaceae bacterium]|nr:cytochrome c3 family protein [Kofleriaceae bacterium]
MVTVGVRLFGRRVVLALCVLALSVFGAAAVAVAAPPPIIKVDNRKFDHDKHAQVSTAAGKAATCASCHTFDASGAPKGGREHPRCAQCHTYPRSCDLMRQAGPKGQARICQVCHTPTSNRCLPPDLPPLPKADSFQARFTHGKHAAMGASIEKDCAQCHAAQAPAEGKPAAAHKLCSGCHNPNGAKPAMAECQSCHQAPRGKPAAGAAAADPFRLDSFDHRAHHTASRQAACLGCHDKMLGTGDSALPRPSMAACQTRCHDGQKAFSAVGTRCTACHKSREPMPPAAAAPQAVSFSHVAHAARNVQIQSCAQCHTVEADGRLTAPLAKKDHMPCAASGCHQTEYMSKTTKICGDCHDAAVPWQKAVARAKPPVKEEWLERIDHAAHLSKIGAGNSACASCHGDKFSGAPAPSGHDGCAPCHGRATAPLMTQCSACHVQTAAGRAASPWSVRATFAHKQHATDPRSRAAAKCTECHKQVATAKDLASVKAPLMADCEGCHNGKVTFKTTGFECSRCHTPLGEGKPTASVAKPAGDARFVAGDARLAAGDARLVAGDARLVAPGAAP